MSVCIDIAGKLIGFLRVMACKSQSKDWQCFSGPFNSRSFTFTQHTTGTLSPGHLRTFVRTGKPKQTSPSWFIVANCSWRLQRFSGCYIKPMGLKVVHFQPLHGSSTLQTPSIGMLLSKKKGCILNLIVINKQWKYTAPTINVSINQLS